MFGIDYVHNSCSRLRVMFCFSTFLLGLVLIAPPLSLYVLTLPIEYSQHGTWRWLYGVPTLFLNNCGIRSSSLMMLSSRPAEELSVYCIQRGIILPECYCS